MARPKKETVDESIVETPVVEDETPAKKTTSRIKKFDDHDYILTHSVTAGGLGIIGAKTDTSYRKLL